MHSPEYITSYLVREITYFTQKTAVLSKLRRFFLYFGIISMKIMPIITIKRIFFIKIPLITAFFLAFDVSRETFIRVWGYQQFVSRGTFQISASTMIIIVKQLFHVKHPAFLTIQ